MMLRDEPTLGTDIDSPLTRGCCAGRWSDRLGYDPLLQFVHASDAGGARSRRPSAARSRPVNVAGDGSISLVRLLRMAGQVWPRCRRHCSRPSCRPAAGWGCRGCRPMVKAVRWLRHGVTIDCTRLDSDRGRLSTTLDRRGGGGLRPGAAHGGTGSPTRRVRGRPYGTAGTRPGRQPGRRSSSPRRGGRRMTDERARVTTRTRARLRVETAGPAPPRRARFRPAPPTETQPRPARTPAPPPSPELHPRARLGLPRAVEQAAVAAAVGVGREVPSRATASHARRLRHRTSGAMTRSSSTSSFRSSSSCTTSGGGSRRGLQQRARPRPGDAGRAEVRIAGVLPWTRR